MTGTLRVVALMAVMLARSPDARSAPRQSTAVLLSDSVRVVAVLADPVDPGRYTFDVIVSRGSRRFTVETVVVADTYALAVAQLRRTTGWKDHYLFVREDGEGNRWKTMAEQVFELRNGQLISLGRMLATNDERLATSWRHGWFYDVYDDLEEDGYLCHACSPRVWLRLREQDGRLVPDLDATWAESADEYAEDDSLARATRHPGAGDWAPVIDPRIDRAVMARYCGRTAELSRIVAEAQSLLPPKEFARFRRELAKVRPGALPYGSEPMTPDAMPSGR
jgi:hypothetical protein